MNIVCSCVQSIGCGKGNKKEKNNWKKIKPRGKTIERTKTVFVHRIHAIREGDTMYYIIERREINEKK